jgi:hypothetical protein
MRYGEAGMNSIILVDEFINCNARVRENSNLYMTSPLGSDDQTSTMSSLSESKDLRLWLELSKDHSRTEEMLN